MTAKRNSAFLPYTTQWILVRLLLPHPVVQRGTFSKKWGDSIARNFDPEKFGVLECVPVGGNSKKYHVFDGQHRLYAAKTYLGPDQLVPCRVYINLPLEMQADKFIGLDDRKKMTALDKWPVRVVRKDGDVLEIQTILRDRGLRISNCGSKHGGNIRAVTAIEWAYRLGGAELLARVLDFLTAAYGDQEDTYHGCLIRGTAFLFGQHNGAVDDIALANKLSKHSTAALFVGASRDLTKVVNLSMQRAVCHKLVGIYNSGRRPANHIAFPQ